MSGYEVEHNISKSPDQEQPPTHSRRPDLSTFFSTLEQVETTGSQNNEHALPTPEMTTAAFRELANGFSIMRNDLGAQQQDSASLLDGMIDMLRQMADDPPSKVEGVPDSFLDELDRVPNKTLKQSDVCPICGNPFLEGTHCFRL